jgi:hypothetical protein
MGQKSGWRRKLDRHQSFGSQTKRKALLPGFCNEFSLAIESRLGSPGDAGFQAT